MQAEHNEFKVGLTVTIVLILSFAVLMFIGKWNTLFQSTKPLNVRFHHEAGIQNLRAKDPVRLGGVNVGRVRKVELKTDAEKVNGKTSNELYVYVYADIPENITVYSDAKIGIGTKFVGEGATLDILDAGGDKGHPLKKDEIINGEPPAGFAELTAKMSKELDDTDPNSLLSQIKTQLDANNPASLMAKIHKTVDDINAVSARIRVQLDDRQQNTLLSNLNQTMSAAKTMVETSGPKVTQTMTHLEATAKRINEDISGKLARELVKNDKNTLLAKLHVSLDSAQSGMANIRVMTQTGRDLFTINRDNLQAVIDNFTETSSHLKATSKEVRRNPWRLLYKPEKAELEYANLMEAARAFSDAAGSLDSANAKLKAMTAATQPNTIDPNDPQLEKIREQIKKSFCQFEEAQKKLWEILKVKS